MCGGVILTVTLKICCKVVPFAAKFQERQHQIISLSLILSGPGERIDVDSAGAFCGKM